VEASAAPFALDIDALIDQLFAPAPEAGTEPEATGPSPGLLGFLAPLPVTPEDQTGSGGSVSVANPLFPRLPQLGIWAIWTLAIVGLTALVLTFDEVRRRRSRS
jgi:hypothetical protein